MSSLLEHGPTCSCCNHDHEGPEHSHEHGHEHGHESKRELILMGISVALFVAGLLFDGQLMQYMPQWLVLAFCYVLPYLLCGYTVLKQTVQGFKRLDFFNEFSLMSIATLAAMALGELPEAVGVMLFYNIGEYLQERAAGNSRRSVKALLNARPSTAHVILPDGNTRDVKPEELGPGARIMVRPGEKIPLDGEVLEGESQADTSPLTGESTPVRLIAGRRVHAGTVNLNGAINVRVTAHYADSSIARVLEMVEKAVARKAPTERFITRMARWYTPAVTGLAALVAVVPPLLGVGAFTDWLYRALVLLVISCPCALLISIPLGYFGGIGAASRRGILVKGGAVLDNLCQIHVAAFDKTGTLTEGVFEVNKVVTVDGVSREELLKAAALAECRSNHPLARSIMQAAQKENITTDDSQISAMQEVAGKGVEMTAAGVNYLAGNAALLESHGLTPLQVAEPGSVVHVAAGGRVLGVLVVSDRVRQQARTAISGLRELGVRTLAMLTGDRHAHAAPIAKDLGLDVLKADLLPENKAEALEALGPVKHTLMVGDGINDAPVLATARVGVAMGGLGAEAAIETADVVILDDNPQRLPEMLRIAHRTRRIVWENIIMALGIKLVFICLGVAGLSGLWEAVFADVGVAVMAVLNASRAGNID